MLIVITTCNAISRETGNGSDDQIIREIRVSGKAA